MEAAIDRKQTAFRLSTDLLDRLRLAAKKQNRSLNNFCREYPYGCCLQ